ncbi:MAG: Gfo/Idh/MocA family oxidoreductase [Halieaceae bacterium]|jgi:predicted dehydrogenase|nr:Gfo/Idh/MocA family oxidoreductase [Halieaceae bacterium]
MGDIVRLGIIGLGNIGLAHAQQVLGGAIERCTLSALCSRSSNPIADQTDARHFSDYRELIHSGECDAVLVASPTLYHREMGAAVLEAGLHLLMEKPLGLSIQEGQELIDGARSDQRFGLMLNQRIDPVFTTMKQQLDNGVLGDLQRTQWTMTNWFRPEVYFQVSDWRATWRGEGGGLLLNQTIHNLDIFQWLCGMPVSLRGFCGFGKYHDIEVEDEATAYLEYNNGATGVFIASTGEAPGVNRLDIIGDRGMLSYDGERLLLTTNTPGTAEFNRSTRDMFGQPEHSVCDISPSVSRDQHTIILNNFVAAVLDGTPLMTPAAEGLNSLALANAILLSAWHNKTISLPLDPVIYQAALARRQADSQLRQKAEIDVQIDMDKSYR